MLKKENRLNKKKDIEIVLKNGRFVADSLMSARIWRVDEVRFPGRDYKKSDLKIGFVVGKKISGSAVKRNKVKRQLREAVRSLVAADRLKTGFYVVLIAKPHIMGSTYKQIMSGAETIFSRGEVFVK